MDVYIDISNVLLLSFGEYSNGSDYSLTSFVFESLTKLIVSNVFHQTNE